MGLPIESFVIATNLNDTVPRYLKTGLWQVNPTIATSSNAMDVSAPNNWPRIMELYHHQNLKPHDELRSISISEAETMKAMKELSKLNYIAEPHSAIAYAGLKAC